MFITIAAMSLLTSVFVESNAESLGSDIDVADDEDDSYAEAENDTDCNSDTNSDLNFTKCQVLFFKKELSISKTHNTKSCERS